MSEGAPGPVGRLYGKRSAYGAATSHWVLAAFTQS